MQNLVNDHSRYLQTFELLLANSAEHQCMKEFIHSTLPDILASIGAGEPTLNVMGVGSGSGEIDLEIIKVLHEKHPTAKVDNEVVEPSKEMLNKYKTLILKMPGLDYVTSRWNTMTATAFEKEWKMRNTDKKMHLINLIQMLYYVKDPGATVSFYRSLLHKDGKALVILLAGECSWARLVSTFHDQLWDNKTNQDLSSKHLKIFLDSKKIPYRNYNLKSLLDITECFTPGNEKGERILDLLTEVVEFSKSAPPELKEAVLEFLKHPDNSQEVNGRFLFDCSTEALLIDA